MATTQVGSIYWDASLKGVQEVKRQLDELDRRIGQLESGRKNILEGIFGGTAGIKQTLSSVSQFVTRMGDHLVHFGQITSVFSYRLSLITAGMGAVAYTIGDVAADFEENLAQIGTQLDIRGPQLEEFTEGLGRNILKLSKEIPVAANDIARAMYFIVSSMSIPDETAQAMLEPLSKAAVAGKSSVEEMAGAVAVIGNVYDHILVMADGTARFVRDDMKGAIALTDATRDQVTAAVTHTTDVLFEAVREGRAEVRDYTSQVGDFLQVAAEAGSSFEEAMAVYTAMTRVTTASQAATWTANFYRQLLRPDFGETLKEWGIQVEEITEGTGEWRTAEIGLTDTQQKRIAYLREYIDDIQRAIGFEGARLGIGDEFAERLRVWYDTGVLLPGVTNAWVEKIDNLNAAQTELNDLLGEGGRQIQVWTGEKVLRPTLDIFTDLIAKINATTSEQEKLNMITQAFPNIRATQAFLRFIGAYEDVVKWSKEWEEATGQTEEAFRLMADTVNAKITRLKNNIYALGISFYLAYEDQIKNFLDGMTKLVQVIGKMAETNPALIRQIVLWGFLLSALAPIALIIGTIAIGFGTLVTTFGMLLSPGVMAVLVGLFAIFGDQLLDVASSLSDIKDFEDLVQFFADIAVQLGLISESDAAEILDAFGVSLEPMGDPKAKSFIDAFRGMIDKIAAVKDDLVEWFNAFRLLLEDIAKREGAIGNIVGYIERLAAVVLPFLGVQLAPVAEGVTPYLPGGKAGPEEKKGVLETGIVVGLGTKIVTAILGALGISGGIVLSAVIAGAVYTAMHPEAVKTFFTATLPEWWNTTGYNAVVGFFGTTLPGWWNTTGKDAIGTFFGTTLPDFWNNTVFPPIQDFWEIDLPLWYETKIIPFWRYFFETWLPRWWEDRKEAWDKFWEEDQPVWWDTNVKPGWDTFFLTTFPTWWTNNIKDPIVNFFTTGLSEWFDTNIGVPVGTFISELPEKVDKLVTETIPNRVGYWMGVIAADVLVFLWELPGKIKDWITDSFIPWWTDHFIPWLTDTALPAISSIILDIINDAWFGESGIITIIDKKIPDLFKGIVNAVAIGIDRYFKAWKSFLEGLAEGFWTRLGVKPPPIVTPTDRQACLDAGGAWVVEQGVGRCVMQRGGLVKRDIVATLHKGEVVFNPQYPRPDLGRVVNSALGRITEGHTPVPVTVSSNVNIGTFAGSQAEMDALERMLQGMSFDMAMRVERKLREARRVEDRRRE